VFGPSGGGQHGPDEFVLLSSVRETSAIIADSIVRLCSVKT